MLAAESAKAPPLIAVLAPFLFSIAFLALSPLLTKRTKQNVQRQIDASSRATGDSTVVRTTAPDGTVTETTTTVPAAVDPRTVADYIEQAVDAVQFLPTTLLPVAGAIFALSSNIAEGTALTVLIVVVIVSVFGDLWLATRGAESYASRKILRLSLAAWAGIIANLIAIGLLVFAG